MRRARQALTKEEAVQILCRNTSGVLSLCGDSRKPYGVPLSYTYSQDKIYFHCALSGYKLDLIKQNPQASFTVIDQDNILPEKFTTKFKSVIVQGTMRIADEDEKNKAIHLLSEKYSPGIDPALEIKRFWQSFLILVLEADEISGKQGIEYLQENEEAD